MVSYAIPALVAIGQVRFHHRTAVGTLEVGATGLSSSRVCECLRHMQPASGGYLEAIPLTSFVVMSLAASGRAQHPVAQAGCSFWNRRVGPRARQLADRR